MKQALFIPGPLPAMNDYISTGSRFIYNTHKKKWAAIIGWELKQQKLKPMQKVFISWTWHEKHMRRDPDNFVAIGKKFILDGLVAGGILPNDGWANVLGWRDRWLVNTEAPGVLVELEEV